jgi:hypothetical protein
LAGLALAGLLFFATNGFLAVEVFFAAIENILLTMTCAANFRDPGVIPSNARRYAPTLRAETGLLRGRKLEPSARQAKTDSPLVRVSPLPSMVLVKREPPNGGGTSRPR